MDAQQALGIAADARRAAARSRLPGWYPPVGAGLHAAGSIALGVALMTSVQPALRWPLLAVAVVTWAGVLGLSARLGRRGGVVPRLAERDSRQRWIDVLPSLVVMVVDVALWATVGLAWMLVFSGIALGASEWFRLARRAR
ncbi:hypothetical protein [Kitasatospora viridis]|uniref:Uncharacterized protein n=1 Tax=Kitasatospora viridis TaxID=281105 RepID=A0A561UGX1_9ACTN|nr:hypothetical protein [Kitasatospora viridis]TWF98610.1 hypothetical protein FHX73_112431 [Kitasatospora viridis]